MTTSHPEFSTSQVEQASPPCLPDIWLDETLVRLPLTDHALRWCLHLLADGHVRGAPRDQHLRIHAVQLLFDPALLLWLTWLPEASALPGPISCLSLSQHLAGNRFATRFREQPARIADAEPCIGTRKDWLQLAKTCCLAALSMEPDRGCVASSPLAFEAYMLTARSGLERFLNRGGTRQLSFHDRHEHGLSSSPPRASRRSPTEHWPGEQTRGVDLPAGWDEELRAVWSVDAHGPQPLYAVASKLFELEQMQLQFMELLHDAKLAAIRDLAYGASHEINNPLANIATRAQTMLARESCPEKQQQLKAIWKQSLRAYDMLADLMLFGKPPRLERKLCSVRQLLQSLTNWADQELAERHAHITLQASLDELVDDVGPALPSDPLHQSTPHSRLSASQSDAAPLSIDPLQDLRINLDPIQWHAAMTALLKNAFEVLGRQGIVNISWGRTRTREQSWVFFRVTDSGPGLTQEAFEAALNPFFSGREAGRGLGFGLSKAWRIVTDHDGKILLNPAPKQGCQISLLFPHDFD